MNWIWISSLELCLVLQMVNYPNVIIVWHNNSACCDSAYVKTEMHWFLLTYILLYIFMNFKIGILFALALWKVRWRDCWIILLFLGLHWRDFAKLSWKREKLRSVENNMHVNILWNCNGVRGTIDSIYWNLTKAVIQAMAWPRPMSYDFKQCPTSVATQEEL